MWTVAAGFLGAHLVELFFYQRGLLERDGLVALFEFGSA